MKCMGTYNATNETPTPNSRMVYAFEKFSCDTKTMPIEPSTPNRGTSVLLAKSRRLMRFRVAIRSTVTQTNSTE